MPTYRYTYLILLLCTAHLTVCAKPQYVFQSETPIANFAKNGLLPCVIQKKAVNLQRLLYTAHDKTPMSLTQEDIIRIRDNGEQDHVHFKDGSALNKDGTWKHGNGKLTNKQKQYLKQNGWNIEQ